MTTNGSRNGHPEDLRAALKAWEEQTLAPALERGPERDADFETSVGPVERLYTPLDVEDID
ncbi:MAG: methylmalonyl-CoA mutase, partial [Dehalococcoidia bacterium]